MATDPEIHEEVEHVSIEPKGDEADEETTEGDAPEGDEPAGEAETPPVKKEQLVQRQPTPAAPVAGEEGGTDGNERLEGETPREFALRMEVTNLRTKLRGERGAELLGTSSAAPVIPQTDANKEILAKYKPEEIKALGEVAQALGFIRADQLSSQTYEEKGQAQLDAFLDKHPEYSLEKDKDGKLWDAFKKEFAIYKQPADPRDFTRIFNKVHNAVFGIQPKSAGGKQAAANEKVTVASRGSAPAPSTSAPAPRTAAPAGIRKDMLKGFSEDELKEMGIE